jgi:hypothetical protein
MYKLIKTDTGRKNNKFHYQVVNAQGEVLSDRHSNRHYVAATIGGEYYFGRLDLVNKGGHGDSVKYALSKEQQPVPVAHLKQ